MNVQSSHRDSHLCKLWRVGTVGHLLNVKSLHALQISSRIALIKGSLAIGFEGLLCYVSIESVANWREVAYALTIYF